MLSFFYVLRRGILSWGKCYPQITSADFPPSRYPLFGQLFVLVHFAIILRFLLTNVWYFLQPPLRILHHTMRKRALHTPHRAMRQRALHYIQHRYIAKSKKCGQQGRVKRGACGLLNSELAPLLEKKPSSYANMIINFIATTFF